MPRRNPSNVVRQIPGYLLHPVLVRIHGATCEVNPTSSHFHHEEQSEYLRFGRLF